MRRLLLLAALALPFSPLFSEEPPTLRDELLKRFATPQAYFESVGAKPFAPVDLVVAWDVHRVATTAFANRVYSAHFYQRRAPESTFYTCHGGVLSGGAAGERHLIPIPFLALLVDGPRLEVVDRSAPDRVVGTVASSGRVELHVPLDLEGQGAELIYDPFADQLLQLTPAKLILPHPFPGDHGLRSGLTVEDEAGQVLPGASLEIASANPVLRNIGYLRDESGLARAVMRMGEPERVLWEDLRTKPGWAVSAWTLAFPRAVYRLDPRYLRIAGGKLVRVAPAASLQALVTKP